MSRKYPFLLNGVDFSDVIHKYGYTTDRTPVYSAQWVDLSGVTHSVKLREKGQLSVTLNDIEAERSLELCRHLRKPDLQVTYHSFQTGETVSERMRIDSMPRSLLMIDGTTPIHAGVTLDFEQY